MSADAENEEVEGIEGDYPAFTDLKGRHVFITGGGSGIGAFFVYAFACQGCAVSFVSLGTDPVEALMAALADRGLPQPFFQPCDLRDPAAVREAMAASVERHGTIDVLVNNAARDTRHSLDELNTASWDDSLSTNLRPCFLTAQGAAPAMRAQGRGVIINVGSNSANLGLSGYPAYVTAKAGIIGLTRALARELGPDGIRVNALVPGWVMTQRQKRLWVTPEALAECLAQQSLKRTVCGQDIANAALFLASDAASMITGQSLVVDGGRVMP